MLGMLLLGTICQVWAQDPVFTQYYTNKLYLNPAYTGYETGTTVNLNYRNQWYKVGGVDTKFNTQSVGISSEIPNYMSAVGFLYMDNIEGIGKIRWQSVAASYAWRSRVCRMENRRWELSLGLKGSYNWYSLNPDRFTFSDQLDPFEGRLNKPTGFTGLLDPRLMPKFFDLDFGALLEFEVSSNHTLRVGGAVNHLVRVEESFLGLDDTLRPRYTGHLSYVIDNAFGFNQENPYQIVIMFKTDIQASANRAIVANAFNQTLFDYGVSFGSRNAPGIFGGFWHRHTSTTPIITAAKSSDNINTLAILLGYELGDRQKLSASDFSTRIGISYEYDYSGTRSDSGGVIEASIIFRFPNKPLFGDCQNRRNFNRRCPKF